MLGTGNSMLKHTTQPSASPWKQGDSEVAVNCDCFPRWKEVAIRIHGKSIVVLGQYYVCGIN